MGNLCLVLAAASSSDRAVMDWAASVRTRPVEARDDAATSRTLLIVDATTPAVRVDSPVNGEVPNRITTDPMVRLLPQTRSATATLAVETVRADGWVSGADPVRVVLASANNAEPAESKAVPGALREPLAASAELLDSVATDRTVTTADANTAAVELRGALELVVAAADDAMDEPATRAAVAVAVWSATPARVEPEIKEALVCTDTTTVTGSVAPCARDALAA